MIRTYLAAGAFILLAACSPPAATTTEEAADAAQSLYDQVNALPAEQEPVFAYQQLIAYQQAHPEVTPACTSVRGTERINVPGNVAPDSIYAPHTQSAVFTVQCGPAISATRMDPNEKWLVVFTPGAEAVTVEHCLGERQLDRCPRQPPVVEIAPTPAP
jgi:hypothetical protein